MMNIKTEETVIIEPVDETDEDADDEYFVSIPTRSTTTHSATIVTTQNKRKEKSEKEIDQDYGNMFRFLWASIHEPQLVNKISIKPCVKPSTEVWLNDLHTHLLGHNGHTNIGGVLTFKSPVHPPGTPLDHLKWKVTSFNRFSSNMEKELEYKMKLEEKRDAAKENKTYEELPQVQKNVILMMGVGPGNEDLPITGMIPSTNMQTVLRA
jgi:hypothetical protein